MLLYVSNTSMGVMVKKREGGGEKRFLERLFDVICKVIVLCVGQGTRLLDGVNPPVIIITGDDAVVSRGGSSVTIATALKPFVAWQRSQRSPALWILPLPWRSPAFWQSTPQSAICYQLSPTCTSLSPSSITSSLLVGTSGPSRGSLSTCSW